MTTAATSLTCPTCAGPMQQTRRGATLSKRGPAYTCATALREWRNGVNIEARTCTNLWTNGIAPQPIQVTRPATDEELTARYGELPFD